MIVVADTSPLNYLVLIRQIDLLPALYGQVMIPTAVLEELDAPETPASVRVWATRPPAWLDVRTPARLVRADEIDRGERAAISLAIEHGASLVLLDDLEARRVAVERFSLVINGTLGVLRDAAINGLVDVDSAIVALRSTSFRLDDRLVEHVKFSVRVARERGPR